MSSEYQFGLAASGDADEILYLYHSLIGTSGCTWSLDYPCMANIVEDIGKASLYCLRDVANRIVAVAAAGEYNELDNDSIEWDAAMQHPCDLARIGVLPGLHHRGLGSLLLAHVMRDVQKRGFDGIRMLVSKTNSNALALYNKNGFSCCGEIFMYGINFYCFQLVFRREN
jgi:ribosomal protein S18 acetylase RimI-like enzyme